MAADVLDAREPRLTWPGGRTNSSLCEKHSCSVKQSTARQQPDSQTMSKHVMQLIHAVQCKCMCKQSPTTETIGSQCQLHRRLTVSMAPDLADAYRPAPKQQMQQCIVGHLPRVLLTLCSGYNVRPVLTSPSAVCGQAECTPSKCRQQQQQPVLRMSGSLLGCAGNRRARLVLIALQT